MATIDHVEVTPWKAAELIKAWKANAFYGAVQHFVEKEGDFFFPWGISVRVLIGNGHNQKINDALWANNFRKAGVLLVKHGLTASGEAYNSMWKVRKEVEKEKVPAQHFHKIAKDLRR